GQSFRAKGRYDENPPNVGQPRKPPAATCSYQNRKISMPSLLGLESLLNVGHRNCGCPFALVDDPPNRFSFKLHEVKDIASVPHSIYDVCSKFPTQTILQLLFELKTVRLRSGASLKLV